MRETGWPSSQVNSCVISFPSLPRDFTHGPDRSVGAQPTWGKLNWKLPCASLRNHLHILTPPHLCLHSHSISWSGPIGWTKTAGESIGTIPMAVFVTTSFERAYNETP